MYNSGCSVAAVSGSYAIRLFSVCEAIGYNRICGDGVPLLQTEDHVACICIRDIDAVVPAFFIRLHWAGRYGT